MTHRRPTLRLATAAFVLLAAALPASVLAHCDTLDGPVVTDARAALAAGDPVAVLKWVRADDEAQVRAAFARTLSVRALGDDAAALADTWFFENLVRIHRAGEGAPYSGLAPAGTTEPGIAAADRAIAEGSIETLSARLGELARAGLATRFERLAAARRHAGHDVEAGRAWVAAYVEFIHYVEGVHAALERAPGAAHGQPEPAAGEHRH